MFHRTDDLRIAGLRPLIAPAILIEELPLSEQASTLIADAREQATRIVLGQDDRLLVIAGPCSIHDPAAALDYARRLLVLRQRLASELCIFMRVYFEKPRTTVGWKGLINDPDMDGSFEINRGLRAARRVLLDLAELGMPAGSEFLDTISPQFIADLISWGAIGARTTESQIHRELASGLSVPVGFKNGTDGNIQICIDALRAARNPHHFLSVTKQGISAIVTTKGNEACHVILRGSSAGPNHDAASVQAVAAKLREQKLPEGVMIDCSHGNSRKDYNRQCEVASEIAQQIAAGSSLVTGVMLESHLVEGRQDLVPGKPLTYGQSITDACISWEKTVPILEELAAAVRRKRGQAPFPARKAP
ncbi:MAG TPA: 3-deoxy-7-phosphoheptulonate synthase [Candidatus Binatia bacterium]|nr:3-deoxy-7-phosphoheptulonate synthase [Candidatus Binatia bacterium]